MESNVVEISPNRPTPGQLWRNSVQLRGEPGRAWHDLGRDRATLRTHAPNPRPDVARLGLVWSRSGAIPTDLGRTSAEGRPGIARGFSYHKTRSSIATRASATRCGSPRSSPASPASPSARAASGCRRAPAPTSAASTARIGTPPCALTVGRRGSEAASLQSRCGCSGRGEPGRSRRCRWSWCPPSHKAKIAVTRVFAASAPRLLCPCPLFLSILSLSPSRPQLSWELLLLVLARCRSRLVGSAAAERLGRRAD